MIAPCIFDQVSHARAQDDLGTGVWARRHRDLADGVQRVLDPARGFAERAVAFAAEIASEDGVTATADEAERLVRAG